MESRSNLLLKSIDWNKRGITLFFIIHMNADNLPTLYNLGHCVLIFTQKSVLLEFIELNWKRTFLMKFLFQNVEAYFSTLLF